jgi:hypothetical protein
VSLCLLAETAVRLVDQTRAATLYELLLPYADRVATSYPEISLGPISRFLEILAATTGHNEEAIRHLEAALAMNERIGARSWLAHTYDDYAHMLLLRGKPNDVGEARRFLHSARVVYHELGITPSVDPLYQPHLN